MIYRTWQRWMMLRFMLKKTLWGIIIVIGAMLIVTGIFAWLPS